jgi:magnesium-transporting ATPase (P-type)
MRTGLALPYMLGIYVISFSISIYLLFICLIFKQKKKKKLGEKLRNFYFFLLIAFQILHVFLLDISVHCALIKYAYI